MLTDTETAIGIVLFLLWRRKKPTAAATPTTTTAPSASDIDDGNKLVARANQAAATKWADLFVQQDVPAELARALARWAGIESSGNPRAVSPLNEVGLLQVGPAMFSDLVKSGTFQQSDWDKFTAATTSNEEHARMAYKLANWLWQRAAKHLHNEPDDYISAAWYAKLYHQRPVDVRDGKMHGPALLMSRELRNRWKNDPKAMHRLRAANVVAFGVPNP